MVLTRKGKGYLLRGPDRWHIHFRETGKRRGGGEKALTMVKDLDAKRKSNAKVLEQKGAKEKLTKGRKRREKKRKKGGEQKKKNDIRDQSDRCQEISFL